MWSAVALSNCSARSSRAVRRGRELTRIRGESFFHIARGEGIATSRSTSRRVGGSSQKKATVGKRAAFKYQASEFLRIA